MSLDENEAWLKIGRAHDALGEFFREVGAEDLRKGNRALSKLGLRVSPLLKTVRTELDWIWDNEELLTQDQLLAAKRVHRDCGTIISWLFQASKKSIDRDPELPSDLRGCWEGLQRSNELLESALQSRAEFRRAGGGNRRDKKKPAKRGAKVKFDANDDRRLVSKLKASGLSVKAFVAKGNGSSEKAVIRAKDRVRKQKPKKAE